MTALCRQLLDQILGVVPELHPGGWTLYKPYRVAVCLVGRTLPQRDVYTEWMHQGYHVLLVARKRCCPVTLTDMHPRWYKLDHSRLLELLYGALQHIAVQRLSLGHQACCWLAVDDELTRKQWDSWRYTLMPKYCSVRKLDLACQRLYERMRSIHVQLPTTEVDWQQGHVVHTQAAGWSMESLKQAVCETLHLESQPVVAQVSATIGQGVASSEYERVWLERMQRHSPEGTYSERLRRIDQERAAFSAARAM